MEFCRKKKMKPAKEGTALRRTNQRNLKLVLWKRPIEFYASYQTEMRENEKAQITNAEWERGIILDYTNMRGIIRLGYEDSVPINSTASPGQSKLLERHRIPNLKVIKNRETRVELHITGLLRFQKCDVIKNDRKSINQWLLGNSSGQRGSWAQP